MVTTKIKPRIRIKVIEGFGDYSEHYSIDKTHFELLSGIKLTSYYPNNRISIAWYTKENGLIGGTVCNILFPSP